MGQPNPGTVDRSRTAESAVVLTHPKVPHRRSSGAFKNQIPHSRDRVPQRDPARVRTVIFQGRSARHGNITPGISVSSAGTQLQCPGRDHGSTRQVHIPQGQLPRTYLGELRPTAPLRAGRVVESQVGRSIHNIKSAVGTILPENSAAGIRSRTQIPQCSTLHGEVPGAYATAVHDFQNPTPHPGSARIRSNSSHSHRPSAVLIHNARAGVPLIQIP